MTQQDIDYIVDKHYEKRNLGLGLSIAVLGSLTLWAGIILGISCLIK